MTRSVTTAIPSPTNGPARAPNRPLLVSAAASYNVRRTMLALFAAGLGIVPLCEILSDRGWLIDVWLSMLIVVGPAALIRLRRPPSAAQIWLGVVLLVPWLTMRFVGQHALLGFIPARATWRDVGALATSLHHTTATQVAPIHSTVAVRLTLCTLLALVAALVDLIAVVGRRGALAGIPLLVVFTVSGAVPREVVSWWLFAISAGAFLILLALDSSDDLNRWGHYVARAGEDRSRAAGAAGAISAQRIAAASIALAIALPIFVPSDSRNFVANLFHDSKSGGSGVGGFGAGSDSSGIDPFVQLKGQLNRKTSAHLFDVTIQSSPDDSVGYNSAVQPFYLRTNVLSDFTGTGWRTGPSGQTQPLGSTQFDSSPGADAAPRTVRFTAEISINGLSSNAPIFTRPTDVRGLGDDTRWDEQDQLLVGSNVSDGTTYRVDVAQPAPSVTDLRSATGTDPALRPWLQLPATATYVRQLVSRLTSHAQTPYAKALAISAYFGNPDNGFLYSLSTKAGDSGDELVDFLKNKVGYCQQYAAAMGVMLRLAGVPSRVVLGYTHPVPDPSGEFTVTTDDAHAWVEAYFSGQGWVPFDPTPLSGITGGSSNDLPWAPHPTAANNGTQSVGRGKSASASTVPSSVATSAAPSASSSAPRGPGLITVLVIIAVLALILVLVLLPWAVRQRRRRHRLRLARLGDTDALWAELSDTATDLGYVWSEARTPRQVAAWLSESSGGAVGSLRTLAAAVERSRYAPSGAGGADGDGRTGGDGQALVDDYVAVRSELSAGKARGERAAAVLWPTSLGWGRWGWTRRLPALHLRRRR